MRAALLAVLLSIAAVGCAAGGSGARSGVSAADTAADACGSPGSARTVTVGFTSAGADRTARLDLPAAPAGRAVPLIVALHFAGGTGPQMASYTGLSKVARAAGMAVLYPTAAKGDHVWRLRDDADGRADVGLVGAALDAAGRVACLDAARTFATGVSNGGGMAAKLACALADRFRAVAPVAPGLKAIAPCPKGRPVGIFEVHGLADRVVPYQGAGRGHAGSVRRWLSGWYGRNRCGDLIVLRPDRRRNPRIFRESHGGCAAPVDSVRLAGTDHGWPGSGGPFPRHDPTGFDANREVVRFFTRAGRGARPGG